MMTEQVGYVYDVFISYSPADRDWVEAELLPRLEQAGLRVAIDYRDFVVGKPLIENIEAAVDASRRTIVVLSPEWIASEWNAFEALLIRTQDPAAARRKLLPLRIRACDLPDGLAKLKLDVADLTAERYKEAQFKRLVRDVEDVVPVPLPTSVRDWGAWRRWLKRYRRGVRRGVAGAIALWLGASMFFDAWPFRSGLGWQAMQLPTKDDVIQLTAAGGILLASGVTEHAKCTTDAGLWRSTDGGAQWQAVSAPLCFKDVEGDRLSSIRSFASPDVLPSRIYGATDALGLLRSDDSGQSWFRLDADSSQGGAIHIPDALIKVVVLPGDAETVIVAAATGGLFRSRDGGNEWARLDLPSACNSPTDSERSLPDNFHVGALLATADTLYAGSESGDMSLRPGPEAGLYRSHDGGNCWQQVDSGEGRYSYMALAAVPGTPAELVTITYDHAAEDGTPEYRAWLLHVDQGRILPSLSGFSSAVRSVYVDPGPPARWYAVTWTGVGVRGRLDMIDEVEPLPAVTRCLIPLRCTETGLSPDVQTGPPLFFAQNRVYRLDTVKWYQRLWP